MSQEPDIAGLLYTLCVDYGYCLGPEQNDRLIENPPTDIEAFIDAVLTAEGRDLGIVQKKERRALRAVVARWFQ